MAEKEPSRDDEPRKCNEHGNHNPFIAFRRFADEQVSSLLGLVGNISNDIAKTAQERRQEVIDQMERRSRDLDQGQSNKNEDDIDGLSALDRMLADMEKQLDSAFSSWEKRVDEARQHSEEWRKSREDKQMQGDEWEESTHTDDDGNTWRTFRWGNSKEGRISQSKSSAMESTMSSSSEDSKHHADAFGRNAFPQPSFFLFSRYSPLILEQEHDPPFPWRDAFEDLLSAEQSQPMAERRLLGAHNSEAPVDWLQGLWKRTRHPGLAYCSNPDTTLQSLRAASPFLEPEIVHGFDPLGFFSRGPFWKSGGFGGQWEDQVSKRIQDLVEEDNDEEEVVDDEDEDANDGEPFTEQDLYERHFGIHGSPDTATEDHKETQANQDETKPSILSTLTTTERTVHPDGSVTTKVVLKKRFSNGKEESSETVHNSVDGSEPKFDYTEQSQIARTSKQDTNESDKGSKSKPGWFWSS